MIDDPERVRRLLVAGQYTRSDIEADITTNHEAAELVALMQAAGISAKAMREIRSRGAAVAVLRSLPVLARPAIQRGKGAITCS